VLLRAIPARARPSEIRRLLCSIASLGNRRRDSSFGSRSLRLSALEMGHSRWTWASRSNSLFGWAWMKMVMKAAKPSGVSAGSVGGSKGEVEGDTR
jgi:hypothetical protein